MNMSTNKVGLLALLALPLAGCDFGPCGFWASEKALECNPEDGLPAQGSGYWETGETPNLSPSCDNHPWECSLGMTMTRGCTGELQADWAHANEVGAAIRGTGGDYPAFLLTSFSVTQAANARDQVVLDYPNTALSDAGWKPTHWRRWSGGNLSQGS